MVLLGRNLLKRLEREAASVGGLDFRRRSGDQARLRSAAASSTASGSGRQLCLVFRAITIRTLERTLAHVRAKRLDTDK